jgi:hypothetical protein
MTDHLRFVLLHHDWPTPHFDLMLEQNDHLRTWRLPTTFDGTQSVPVIALREHRLAYLDYEGPVSGNRGQVRRVDSGGLIWLNQDPATFELQGIQLCGRFLIADGVLARV